MMRTLYFLILTVFPITLLSCSPTIAPESAELDQRVQIEARKFEELLTDLSKNVSMMTFPKDISLKPVIPDNWLFEICQSPSPDRPSKYAVGVPVPKGVKTGLTITGQTKGWDYYSRTTQLNPHTNHYVVSSLPSKDRYKNLEGLPKDFREYPERQSIDCLSSYIVVLSPYYIPENVTHGLYFIDGPKPFKDGGTNYDLMKIVGKMFDANPYKEKTSLEQYKTSDLGKLMEQLVVQIAVMSEDINNAISFVNSLEHTYFQPNAISWNTQDELVNYKKSMAGIRSELSQIELYLQNINNWDFSSISFTLERVTLPTTTSPITEQPPEPSASKGEPEAAQMPVAGSKLIYMDDFSDPNSGWLQISTEELESSYKDGEYHILAKKSNWATWRWNRNAGRVTDFILEIDARLVSGPKDSSYGLIFRVQNNDNFYRFIVDENGHYLIGTRSNGEWTKLLSSTKSEYINKGNSTNRLKIVCQGSQIQAYVNGYHLSTIVDDLFTDGWIGCTVVTHEPNTHVAFDNIKVFELD